MPSYPTYFCMPAEKRKGKSILCPFLFQLLMIAGALCFPLGARNAHLKNRPDVRGGCQPQFFLMQTLILCVFPRSRCARPSPSAPSAPPTRVAHTPASQLSGPVFPHLPAVVGLCAGSRRNSRPGSDREAALPAAAQPSEGSRGRGGI